MQPQNRKKTRTAAIINIVTYSVNIAVTAITMLISILAVGAVGAAGNTAGAEASILVAGLGLLLIGMVIGLVFDIICLVLSCKSLKIAKMSVQDYASKKNIITACVVINILIVALGVFNTISSGFGIGVIIDIAIWVLLIVAAVFYMQDMKANQKLADEEQVKVIAEASETSTDAKQESNIDKLAELDKMKADGLITEEEFEKMKKDLMK